MLLGKKGVGIAPPLIFYLSHRIQEGTRVTITHTCTVVSLSSLLFLSGVVDCQFLDP